MNERLQQLLGFLEKEPNDPFLLYAIATEYRNHDTEKAKVYFEQLLHEHDQYLPTYYHAAHLFFDLGEDERAKEIYEQGIALAEKQDEKMALTFSWTNEENLTQQVDIFPIS